MYGHAAFLLLTCWKHPGRRAIFTDRYGRNVCSNCAEAEAELLENA